MTAGEAAAEGIRATRCEPASAPWALRLLWRISRGTRFISSR